MMCGNNYKKNKILFGNSKNKLRDFQDNKIKNNNKKLLQLKKILKAMEKLKKVRMIKVIVFQINNLKRKNVVK